MIASRLNLWIKSARNCRHTRTLINTQTVEYVREAKRFELKNGRHCSSSKEEAGCLKPLDIVGMVAECEQIDRDSCARGLCLQGRISGIYRHRRLWLHSSRPNSSFLKAKIEALTPFIQLAVNPGRMLISSSASGLPPSPIRVNGALVDWPLQWRSRDRTVVKHSRLGKISVGLRLVRMSPPYFNPTAEYIFAGQKCISYLESRYIWPAKEHRSCLSFQQFLRHCDQKCRQSYRTSLSPPILPPQRGAHGSIIRTSP